MSATPPGRTEGKQRSTGATLVMVGGAVIVVGLLVLVLLDTAAGIPVMVLGALPVVAGLVLIGTSAVSKRAREGKPWA
jgi:uncharacterized membrane protein HdeD (DUF308 family)